jgi:serine protease AprX
LLSTLPDTSEIDVVVTYFDRPTASDLMALQACGVFGGTLMRRLPMVVVSATKTQIRQIAELPHVRSVFANATLSLFDQESANLVAVPEARTDPDLRGTAPGDLTGLGTTIAILDTGIDGNHPDLPYGTKLIGNVRLNGSIPGGIGFVPPSTVENVTNTDLVLGHGTFVASVAAGTGLASGGSYAGVAPGASVLGLSAGDVFIVNMLEGFDYVLDHAQAMSIRVVNCSWGSQGWFDPDDPVNVATRALYDAGISVVFAAGNHGPSPDTLNPYSVAPWVIGVGSTAKDGSTSSFSSRGIFEELLYHPTLTAPGEAIVAAKAGLIEHVGGVAGIVDPTEGQTVPPQYQSNYTVSSGTSFAAPHVAGTIALMLQAAPGLTPSQIRTILQKTATPSVLKDRSEIGAGRLDAWAAVASAVHPDRTFGAHLPGWLDQRSYAIAHQAPTTTSHVLPRGPDALDPAHVHGAGPDRRPRPRVGERRQRRRPRRPRARPGGHRDRALRDDQRRRSVRPHGRRPPRRPPPATATLIVEAKPVPRSPTSRSTCTARPRPRRGRPTRTERSSRRRPRDRGPRRRRPRDRRPRRQLRGRRNPHTRRAGEELGSDRGRSPAHPGGEHLHRRAVHDTAFPYVETIAGTRASATLMDVQPRTPSAGRPRRRASTSPWPP